ncbi:type III secretion protein ATPase [Caballeronia mineralivorans PML1(12)]|uniref:protein-secreting ATPase n=1 Tax=Caballeronia mineralivorans PML1(12) TaxID=908627 RepID=A0A0J1CLU8_9BURK|nr:EscN/YscN/HrcN family type III secretion system ATPase [Caballeronia mineralivorans]KLU21494.1 type III secretion protein ATPase [Caballeronia mineralivorans PML1(12)]
MRMPDQQAIFDQLDARLVPAAGGRAVRRFGRVIEVGATLVKATLPGAALGELCMIEPDGLMAEVVALDRESALLSPFADPVGMRCGQTVLPLGTGHRVAVGEHLVGAIVDGLGRMLGGGQHAGACEYRPMESTAPDPLTRSLIAERLPLGVRAIDGLLTVGRGQRIGIFAAAGGGKSTLLSMICDGSLADVIVLALVGERGREVREFLEHALTPEARARSVVVVATSDRPALERLKAAYTATTIAEYFRDQGKNVLLMVDSLTRFARAGREIGLAAGEPPAAGSFPPSVFARMPRLLERAGCAAQGSITGIYTVLVEGDDMNEPVADEVRSILDGHIVLSRKLAEANHYPAIDVAASVSRVMNQVTTEEHQQWAGRLRRLTSRYREIELLVRVGEYRRGNDEEADEALDRRQAIDAFLQQGYAERSGFDETLMGLKDAVSG